jgi:hypothetical protein
LAGILGFSLSELLLGLLECPYHLTEGFFLNNNPRMREIGRNYLFFEPALKVTYGSGYLIPRK